MSRYDLSPHNSLPYETASTRARRALLDGLDPYRRRKDETTDAYLARTGGEEALAARHPELAHAWGVLAEIATDLEPQDPGLPTGPAFERWLYAADPRTRPAIAACLHAWRDALAAEGCPVCSREAMDGVLASPLPEPEPEPRGLSVADLPELVADDGAEEFLPGEDSGTDGNPGYTPLHW